MKKKLLFVSYGGGHINMALPLIKTLLSDERYSLTILALTTSRFVLEREGISYIGVSDLEEYRSSSQAQSLGKQLSASYAGGLLPLEETQAYLGIGMSDLINELGPEIAWEKYNSLGRSVFLPVQTMRSFLRREMFDLVVTTNSPRTEKATVLAAQAENVKCVVLVDMFDEREVTDRLSQPGYGTRVCVLNETVREEFIQRGRRDSEIVATGNPAFDSLFDDQVSSDGSQLRLEMGWDQTKVILWARANDPKNEALSAQIEQVLADSATKHGAVLVIRPHPNEDLSKLKLPSNAVLSKPADALAPLLYASDVVVTIMSTVGLQGALLGKSVLQVRMIEEARFAPFVEMGVATPAYSLSDIQAYLDKELTSHQSKKPSQHKDSDLATRKVIDLIHGLTADASISPRI